MVYVRFFLWIFFYGIQITVDHMTGTKALRWVSCILFLEKAHLGPLPNLNFKCYVLPELKLERFNTLNRKILTYWEK